MTYDNLVAALDGSSDEFVNEFTKTAQGMHRRRQMSSLRAASCSNVPFRTPAAEALEQARSTFGIE